jgi:hypothetical protein
MAGPTITQRIALEGADQIKQALSQIGKAGQEAFQQIRDAGEGVKLSAIEAAAKRVGVSVDEMRARVAAARSTLDTLGATSREADIEATGHEPGQPRCRLVPTPPGANNLRPIHLQIGSEMFAGMLAPDDVAQKLLRVAVTRQIRSAGRKPSYYGKGR